ncbi:uncharacterized protein LOC129569877 isoform X2 [Sitodiplosis mosellana]|uniref:uncharacterized protein LOC129569877 isoform X2 n=1 Tax=Sitodiplosis mosellana TaxID=263140 RepID=UPI002443AA8E|nr:uncharacterized protein LOC129569877 isoform X2 [Sitodiplosis mosellana]
MNMIAMRFFAVLSFSSVLAVAVAQSDSTDSTSEDTTLTAEASSLTTEAEKTSPEASTMIKKVVCPMPTHSELAANNLARFKLERIDWNLCTHVVSGDERGNGDAWNLKPDNAYKQLTYLKQTYPHLKINFGIRRTLVEYLDITSDPTHQRGIIDRLYEFIAYNNFDGINLQLEDIEESNISPEEFDRIVSFVAAFKAKLENRQYLLTVSFTVSESFDFKRFDLAALSNSAEFITFVPNYKPSKDGFKVNDAKESLKISYVQDKIEKLAEAGVCLSKVVMGIHFMGFGFTTKPDGSDDDTTFDRMHRYNELELCNIKKWTTTHKDSSLTIRTKTTNDGIVVMENTRAIANKVRFVISHGLTGVTPIYAPFDDFFGLHEIDPDTFEDFKADGIVFKIKQLSGHKHPLLRTINQAFDLTFDECAQKAELKKTTIEDAITTTDTIEVSTLEGATPPTEASSWTTEVQTASPEDPSVSTTDSIPESTDPASEDTTSTTEASSWTAEAQTTSPEDPCISATDSTSESIEDSTSAEISSSTEDITIPKPYIKAHDKKVDWSMCTHVISVAETEEDPWESNNEFLQEDLKHLTDLKQKNPDLKVLMGVRRSLTKYSEIVKNPSQLRRILQNSRDIILKHKMNGMNLQLDDIALSTNRLYLFDKFVQFVAALKTSFEESNLLLTATINIPETFNHAKYDFEKLSESLEFMNVVHQYTRPTVTYKIDDATKSLEISNDKAKLERMLGTGVASEKVVLGVHFTGPAFALTAYGKEYDAEFQNIHGYGSICKAQSTQPERWERSYTNTRVPILRKTGNVNLVIAIENSRSIANKVRLAIKYGLGGIAPNSIVYDDFDGKCDVYDTFDDFIPKEGILLDIPQRTGNSIPLLRTINEAISLTLDELKQEVNISQVSETTSTTTSTTTPETTTGSTSTDATIPDETTTSGSVFTDATMPETTIGTTNMTMTMTNTETSTNITTNSTQASRSAYHFTSSSCLTILVLFVTLIS